MAAPVTSPGAWSAIRNRVRRGMKPWRQANAMARWLVVAGSVITLLFALMAVFAGPIAPYPEDEYRTVVGVEDGERVYESLPRRAAPSRDHPFGTTSARFDVYSRVVHGARAAFGVVLLSTLVAMGIGVPLGLISGYRGGWLDRGLVLFMDAIYVFPPLLLAIIAAFVLKQWINPGLPSAAVAVGAVYVPQYFRVIRNHTISVKEEAFVEAARSLGAPPRTIVFRYVFFNVVQSVPVIFTLNAADAVLTLAALGFLGFGVPYPQAEWGLDISRAISDAVSGFWWTALFPGLAIMLLVTGLTLVGEGLNDIVNPLLRARGFKGKPGGRLRGGGAATGTAGPAEALTDAARQEIV